MTTTELVAEAVLVISGDGTGVVEVAGQRTPIAGTDLGHARLIGLQVLHTAAVSAGRPVQVTSVEDGKRFELTVFPDGRARSAVREDAACIVVASDGSGHAAAGDLRVPIEEGSIDAARRKAIELVVMLAARTGSPVETLVVDPEALGRYTLDRHGVITRQPLYRMPEPVAEPVDDLEPVTETPAVAGPETIVDLEPAREASADVAPEPAPPADLEVEVEPDPEPAPQPQVDSEPDDDQDTSGGTEPESADPLALTTETDQVAEVPQEPDAAEATHDAEPEPPATQEPDGQPELHAQADAEHTAEEDEEADSEPQPAPEPGPAPVADPEPQAAETATVCEGEAAAAVPPSTTALQTQIEPETTTDEGPVADPEHDQAVPPQTAVDPAPAAGADPEPAATPTPARTRERRLLITVAVGGVLAALALVGVGAGLWTAVQGRAHAQELAVSDALLGYQDAAGAYTTARSELEAACATAAGLGDLSAQVVDAQTTTDLAAALLAAQELSGSGDLPEVPAAGGEAPWRSWSADALLAGTQELEDATARLSEASTMLAQATGAVQGSHDGWLVAQARADLQAATGELAAAIDAANAVLADSDGRVQDDGVRQALAGAITSASAVRDSVVAEGASVEEVSAAAVGVRTQVGAVGAASAAVTSAQASWEAARSVKSSAPASGGSSAPSSQQSGQTASQPARDSGGGGGSFEISADPLATDSTSPGTARVQVSVSGDAGQAGVFLTIAGRTTQIGSVSGSGTVTGTVTGLPAGVWPWHVTVAGLQATGTPDIRVY